MTPEEEAKLKEMANMKGRPDPNLGPTGRSCNDPLVEKAQVAERCHSTLSLAVGCLELTVTVLLSL